MLIISLRGSPRRQVFGNRWKGIEYQFIDAVPSDSPLIDYYLSNVSDQWMKTPKGRATAACFASHLKAIRYYLERGGRDGVLIGEDDIRPSVNWKEEINSFPRNYPLVLLSYLVFDWTVHQRLSQCSYSIGPHTWGTQLYWISHEYAKQCLIRFDRPWGHIEGILTSERIPKESGGILWDPPLAIEDGSPSTIRDDDEMKDHQLALGRWPDERYIK